MRFLEHSINEERLVFTFVLYNSIEWKMGLKENEGNDLLAGVQRPLILENT